MTSIEEAKELVDGLILDYQQPRINLDTGNGEFRLRTMLKMAQWAVDHQPLQKGDQVHLRQDKVRGIDVGSGWHPWREKMLEGPFTVDGIGYNGAHDYWYFMTTIDGAGFMFEMSWATS